jgi:hypothetical protein
MRRRTNRLTKEMPESLIASITKSDPVCMAKMLQFHAHAYSSMDILLVLSKSKDALQHAIWPLQTDFATLQYISWMCPEDTSRVLSRLPELQETIPEKTPLDILADVANGEVLRTTETHLRPDNEEITKEVLPLLPESPKDSKMIIEKPKKQNVKKVGARRSVQKQDEGIVLEKSESP